MTPGPTDPEHGEGAMQDRADTAGVGTAGLVPGPRRLRRRAVSIEAAAIAGLVCAVGWSLSLGGLLTVPEVGADAAEITSFYAEPAVGAYTLLWLNVLVASTIAFLWFVGVIRGRLGDNEPKLFGTVFFGASILLAAMLFVGASLLAAPAMLVAIGDTAPAPEVVSMTRAAAATVLSVITPRVATLVLFATAGLGRSTGALPRWLVMTTYVIGVGVFVNVTVARPTIFIVPAWIALVSVVLLVRRPSRTFEIPTGDVAAR